ncbi:MAG: SIR2 family protein [Planctomycetota bacterium]
MKWQEHNRPTMGLSRIGIERYARDDGELRELSLDMLARELNSGRVVAFVGSGVSRAYDYPSWSQFADKVVDLAKQYGGNSPRTALQILDQNEARSSTSVELPRIDRMLLRVSAAKSVIDCCPEAIEALHRLIRNSFGRPRKPIVSSDSDPLEALIGMGIRRFLTINYDAAIENALRRIDSSGEIRSLWCDGAESAPEKLVQLAVGSPGFEKGVFHCHGVAAHPDSVILSEEDYQRTYLRRTEDSSAYRAALETALASNPILFVGVGMEEPDLLRPLRRFVAERAHESVERPLFALLPRPVGRGGPRPGAHNRADAETRKFLHVRYGVTAIFYDVRKPGGKAKDSAATVRAHSQALCRELKDLAGRAKKWWSKWLDKPRLRVVDQPPPEQNVMILHEEIVDREFYNKKNEALVQEALQSTGPTLLLGAPGSGKGVFGLRIARGIKGVTNEYGKRFFATMRFRNEMMSVIDAAATFFTGNVGEGSMDPIRRLEVALSKSTNLLVLGGIDRLLFKSEANFLRANGPEAEARAATAVLAPGPPDRPEEANAPHQTEPHTGNPHETERVAAPMPQDAAVAPGRTHGSLRSLREPCGRPNLSDVRRLLEVLAGAQAKVVLTSALWPAEIPRSRISRLYDLDRDMVTDALHKKGVTREHARTLYTTIHGNAYCLYLVQCALQRGQAAKAKNREWIEDLLHDVTSHDRARGYVIVVRRCLDLAQRRIAKSRRVLLLDAVRQVALVTTPTSVEAVAASLGRADTDETEKVLQFLAARGLVTPIKPPTPIERSLRPGERRYTAHTLVRAQILESLGVRRPVIGESHRFGLPSYASETDQMDMPNTAGHEAVTTSVDHILDAVEAAIGQDAEGNQDLTRTYIRTAFGMMRSRWSAIGLGQLWQMNDPTGAPHYDAYQRRLLRLANAVKSADPPDGRWRFYQEDPKGIYGRRSLYPDELGWLYNELGLVSYIQGHLRDAHSLAMQATELALAAERGDHGRRWRQTQLALAIISIERGGLDRATRMLQEILPDARAQRDDDSLVGRLIGFLGWLHHLRGDLSLALSHYNDAIEICEGANVHRGRSIFLRLRGAVHFRREDEARAKNDFRQSIAVAELGRYIDLANLTRLAEAVLVSRLGGETAGSIERVLEFARRTGTMKIEAESYKALGEIALASGDFNRAEHSALRSLSICASCGMKLKMTSILVLLGRIAMKRGRPHASRSVFDAALRLGRNQGYQLQVEEAERGLEDCTARRSSRLPFSEGR